MSGVLCEIQRNRRMKSRVVHMDKLVPVHGQYDGGWVATLPAKRERGVNEDHLKGVK